MTKTIHDIKEKCWKYDKIPVAALGYRTAVMCLREKVGEWIRSETEKLTCLGRVSVRGFGAKNEEREPIKRTVRKMGQTETLATQATEKFLLP